VVEAGDALEDKLNELAFEGNVTAAIFLLKGLRPEKYRERYEHTNLLEIDPHKLTPEQLDVIIEHLIRKERGNLSPVDMEKAKAMIEAGQTLEGTFERAGGEGRTRDVAAPDADWFDQGSR